MTATSNAKTAGQELKEDLKNQVNMIPPKEYNNLLLTKTKDIEIYDLLNEKIKIALLSKLNELQEIEKGNSKNQNNYT